MSIDPTCPCCSATVPRSGFGVAGAGALLVACPSCAAPLSMMPVVGRMFLIGSLIAATLALAALFAGIPWPFAVLIFLIGMPFAGKAVVGRVVATMPVDQFHAAWSPIAPLVDEAALRKPDADRETARMTLAALQQRLTSGFVAVPHREPIRAWIHQRQIAVEGG